MIFAAILKLLSRATHEVPPEPLREPFITIPKDNCWGHHVEWSDFKSRTIWGHIDNHPMFFAAPGYVKPPRPIFEVGSIIRCEMKSGRNALFRVTELTWARDPSDMFFGKVEDVGIEPEAALGADERAVA